MSVAKSLDRMPEAFVSDKSVTRAVSRAVKAGKLRKLASRLYSRNGALLGTGEAELSAPSAVARHQGRPYDPDRLALLQVLHAALRDHPPLSRIAPGRGPESRATLAFFDAYFSNFIEGTEARRQRARWMVRTRS